MSVRLLCGCSSEGLKSTDVARGKLAVILVDCTFCCCISSWHLLVASNFARRLVARDTVRPGREIKWPRWIAQKNVDGMGLKGQGWRKVARSCLVPPDALDAPICRTVSTWSSGTQWLEVSVILVPVQQSKGCCWHFVCPL